MDPWSFRPVRILHGPPSGTTPLTRPLLHPGELENGGCLEPVPLGTPSDRPETENVMMRQARGNPRVFALSPVSTSPECTA